MGSTRCSERTAAAKMRPGVEGQVALCAERKR